MTDEDYKRLERKRAAAKGWVTRSATSLSTLCMQTTVTKLELEDAIGDFDRRLAAWDDAQTAVEMEITDTDELEEDITAADLFRRQSRIPRVQAAQRLAELLDENKPPGELTHSISGSESVMSNINLPRIELPKFSGNVLEWQSFWEQFRALVGESNIPAVSKFGYLRSSLEGEAKRTLQGLTLTAANFPVACSMLEERFGKPERIIFAHIQALLNITLPPKSSGSKYIASLWTLQDQLNSHVRSLEALGVKGDQYGIVLTPVILSRLPHDIRMEWSREGSGHESDLTWLMNFLKGEIERRDRSDSYKESSRGEETRSGPLVSERKKVAHGTASALVTASSGMSRCGFCGKPHLSETCASVSSLTHAELEEKVRMLELCFRCLCKGHISKGCKAKCGKCRGKHNVLFCFKNLPREPRSSKVCDESTQPGTESVSHEAKPQSTPVNNVSVSLCNFEKSREASTHTCCVLQTARVNVRNSKGKSVQATVLFDTGSDRSYVSSSLVKKVKPDWVCSEPVTYSAFGNNSSKRHVSDLYDLRLEDCKGVTHSLVAVEIPTICAPLVRPSVPKNKLKGYESLHLADDYSHNSHFTVDILIGIDCYWNFMLPNQVCAHEGLVAQESVFGWVLSGSWSSSNQQGVHMQLLCVNGVSESELKNFWDLESVGIRAKENVMDASNDVQQRFNESIRFVNGKYEVALPWKSDSSRSQLLNNVKIAEKRLHHLCHKFQREPHLKEEYDAVLKGYEEEGICEEVPPSQLESVHPTYYLPHRPVVREGKSSTKVRPVFDASAVSYNGFSLNDCLEVGPSLNPDLIETILRFRRWQVAFTADITKAFLQVGVREEDRDVHRFLWKCGDSVRTMRFTRVPFGNKSSPFLLNATVKYHLDSCPASEVVNELKENLYVDDWLSGSDNVVEGKAKFTEACTIFAKAGMTLTKWTSNCKKMMDEFDQKGCVGENEAVKVLGLQWDVSQDCFSFGGLNVDAPIEVISTKRSVLSLIAKLFDPLGLISPFIMFVKILFQDVWRKGTEWDEVLPGELLHDFQRWLTSMNVFQTWNVQRCYFLGVSWKLMTGAELHAYGDASEKGYGACVYLRLVHPTGKCKVSFVMSRGRVAPIKSVSLPRLELLAALLCARLITYVKSALHLDVPLICWTDSLVTLSWIKGEAHKWKTFVRNRVTEIQELTSPSNWYHCPGKDNPADLISRGVLAEQLVSSELWLNGPEWLSHPLGQPQQEQQSSSGGTCEEETMTACLTVNASHPVSGFDPVFEFTRWSKLSKAVSVVGWVMRFISNCRLRGDRHKGPLTFEELTKAKTKLIYCAQREAYSREIATITQGKVLSCNSSLRKLDPFLDNDGLLRVKGRLDEADILYESKHPIIIPAGHVSRLIILFQHHILKHAGVATLVSTLRNNYWIVGLRRMSKSICKTCVPCRRHDSRACNQPVAPLPELRVTRAPPFSTTGVDYAGPMFCLDVPSKKFYLLLFTCAVIRAVHLELTDSLSKKDCKLAIRRFVSRRGLPNVFYSDNAQTFVSVSHELQNMYGHLAPNWKFIVPRAPWWGGWWERLIRSVKVSLKKTIGSKCLTRPELETTLHEIEACINSRPLTFINEEPGSFPPLSPSHFLIGRTAGYQVEGVRDESVPISARDLCVREQLRQQQLENFWKLWSNDYIRNLPPAVKGFFPRCDLKKGSMVLIKENNVPRLSWPLGIVVDVYPGRDNVVRSVKVKTSKGIVCRPIQRLHDLEISSCDAAEMDDNSENVRFGDDAQSFVHLNADDADSGTYTRKGRRVKAPVKLDL